MKKTSLLVELRATPETELRARLSRVEKELAQMYIQRSLKRLSNVMQVEAHRREIARIKTIFSEKGWMA